ncbi:MAG: ACP S-malonyltransferase [Nevskiales bacterium]
MQFAFVFPGQGSQSLGMLSELAAMAPAVTATFAEASAALGYDLWALTQQGPAEQLDQTENTQPALLAAGVACWRAWQAAGGPAPVLLAGHSLGEYSALVCAGSLILSDAVKLVRRRGQLMQAAVPAGQGAMAAIIGLDDEAARALCAEVSAEGGGAGVLQAVNFNAPGQVVIAGTRALVEQAVGLAPGKGARMTKLLPVSVPSHCELMRGAAAELSQDLAKIPIAAPVIPVLHNVDCQARQHADEIRDVLTRQLYSPVLWVQSVQAMAAQGVQVVIECGPGRVLSGLLKRIDKSLKLGSLHDSAGLQQALALVKGQ